MVRIFTCTSNVSEAFVLAETKDTSATNIYYPEYRRRHPEIIVSELRQAIEDNIKEGLDVNLHTNSELYLDTARLAIAICKSTGEWILYTNTAADGLFKTSINSYGIVADWPREHQFPEEKVLTELLEQRRNA